MMLLMSGRRSRAYDCGSEDFPRPFWIGIYPEGTRLTPKKKAESDEFALKKGLPPLKNCMHPRTKGFVLLRESYVTSVALIGWAECLNWGNGGEKYEE